MSYQFVAQAIFTVSTVTWLNRGAAVSSLMCIFKKSCHAGLILQFKHDVSFMILRHISERKWPVILLFWQSHS